MDERYTSIGGDSSRPSPVPPFPVAESIALDPPRIESGSVRCQQKNRTGRRTMKAIVVTDQAAGTAGMTLVDRPEPQAAINDVVVQVHASGFTSGELTWPS